MTEKKIMLRGIIGELYGTDSWFRAFMDECFILWGYPCSGMACMSQKDRTMFAWGMLHLVQSLTKDRATWEPMRDKIEPDAAAWEYSRRLYETTGLELIPTMPGEAPPKEDTLALPNPMKVDGTDALSAVLSVVNFLLYNSSERL